MRELLWSNYDDSNNQVNLLSMIDKSKDTCKISGFEEGTEKFADCALKLYTQEIDLAAKQNQQVIVKGSSGNAMTIYDPVRDNQRMINQGMGMIMGKCKFGYDC